MNKKKLNLAIVGLGNIGSYLVKYLLNNKKNLSKKNNCFINEIFISAENDLSFYELRTEIYNKLFNGFYCGWISIANNLAKIRSVLFDMGCVQEEKNSASGKYFLKVKIGNEELDNFVKLNGFDICYEEDILLKEVNN